MGRVSGQRQSELELHRDASAPGRVHQRFICDTAVGIDASCRRIKW